MNIEFTYFQPLYGAANSFIYSLVLALLLLTIISFIKGKFDLLYPSFIYNICLTGCCSLAALYTRRWNLPLHFNTALIIIIMSLLFFIGGCLADSTFFHRKFRFPKDNIDMNNSDSQGFHINWIIWSFLIVLILYCLYLNYVEFINVANQVTAATDLKEMLGPVINGLAHQNIQMTRWNAYRLRFANGMAYLSVLAIWINIMDHKYVEVVKWCAFVLLYIPFMVLTGGRQHFMYLIMFSMISFFLLYRREKQKNETVQRTIYKEFAIIGIAIASFLVCFLGIGIINGKIGSDTNIMKVFVHYAGINISAFDVYINELVIPDNQYIGTTTMVPIYGFLHAHGFNVPQFFQYITLFTAFGPATTNVYTAFYRYIHDFGYFGCALIMILLGFFYTYIYRQLYCYGLKNWMILVYASISYPIFLMGREERFFNEIFSTSKLTFIAEILILYKIFELLNERRIQVK
ncbi:O-antigen polymerase [Acidaminococcus timonensis]|jgi:oligosaccharide repeat unit polymerase|uniref:O-antigen polymerase n=1 Tax=Acidaminococcus timonensis TaxID=1871002 RepID=UPI003A5C3018